MIDSLLNVNKIYHNSIHRILVEFILVIQSFSVYIFRWNRTDRIVDNLATNTDRYVRHRPDIDEPISMTPSTLTDIKNCPSESTTNVKVKSSIDDFINENYRPNRDEEAETQRKHRSAQARRERRLTQNISNEDIKKAEQQIQNQSNQITLFNNNKIGSPSILLSNDDDEYDVQTQHLQNMIEDEFRKVNKDNQVIFYPRMEIIIRI